MDKLLSVLDFLRIIDADRKLSLTNLSVWITLIHLATAKNVVTPIDLGALLGALASYQTKRVITSNVVGKRKS